MFKRLICLLFSLFLIGCAPQQETTINKYQFSIEQLRHSTILLVEKQDVTYTQKCSGVWLNQTTFITAYHCISRNPATEQEFLDKVLKNKDPNVIGSVAYFLTWKDVNELPNIEVPILMANAAVVIAVDRSHDLALLASVDEDLQHSYVGVSAEHLKVGNKVHVIGHPNGLPYSYSPGTISNVREIKNPADYKVKLYQIHSSAFHGYSGGGAFNQRGELVGLSSFIYHPLNAGPFLTMFTHNDSLINFLTDEQIISGE